MFYYSRPYSGAVKEILEAKSQFVSRIVAVGSSPKADLGSQSNVHNLKAIGVC